MSRNLKEEIAEQHEENKKKLKALGPVKLTILAILVVGTVLSYVFYEWFFGKYSAWCHEPNTGVAILDTLCRWVPKIITCIQFITFMLVVVTIILIIIRKLLGKTQRSKTVAMLLCNLIRWITAIVLVIAVLYIWGVDATALITGAGVVTLVVGLGMQSLIADVVAGLFIVFENEFNVGDWITVGDFRGEVISIGIRTTKLRAAGNIKILNNNSIQGVLNHTIEPSIVKCLIDIEYGADLPKVEGIIKSNIGALEVPGALTPVQYDGVAALGASGVTLQFEVSAYEGDYFVVERALNGAVKNMFDKNGINIPFPQIVVHEEK